MRRILSAILLAAACQRGTVRGVGADASAPAQVDFGAIAVGESKELGIDLSDGSTLPLTLMSAAAGAPFAVQGAPATLDPGATHTLHAIFTPTAAGAFDVPLTLALDSRGTPSLTVHLKGSAYVRALSVSSTLLDFGPVTVGQTKSLTFEVTNAAPAALDASVNAEDGSEDFSADPDGDLGELSAGEARTVTVTFAPTTAGAASGALDVDCGGCTLQRVALWGTGVLAETPPRPAALAVTPPQLAFNAQLPVASIAPQTLTVSNPGDLPLSWSAAIEGSELSLSQATGRLDGGSSVDVSVSVAVAAVNALRHVTFSATAAAPVTQVVVPVTLHIAPQAALLVEPLSLALAAQLPSAPAPQSFRIHNNGGGTLHWSVTPVLGLTLSLPGGTLAAGDVATVTVAAASVPLLPQTFSRTVTVVSQESGAQDVNVTVSFTPPPPPPQYGGSVWPKFHQGNTCTGLSSVSTATRGHLRFRTSFGPARMGSMDGTYVGSPSLAADGTVYQLGGDGFNGTVSAFNPATGASRWSVPINSPAAISPSIEATPTVVKDGSIFVMTGAESAGTHFYKFRPDGAVLWQEPFGSGYGDGFDSSPAIGADGTLWLAYDEAPGVVLFTQGDSSSAPHEIARVGFPGGTDIESQSGAISDDGVAYWSDDGILRVMDKSGMLWTHDGTDGDFPWVHSRSAAMLMPTGVAVFARANTDFDTGAVTTSVIAVTAGRATGRRLWRTSLGPTMPSVSVGPSDKSSLEDRVGLSSPAMGPDGSIYIGHADGLYKLNASTGAVVWHAAAGLVASSPAVGADGTVFFGSMDGKIHAVDPNGHALWTIQTGGQVNSSPAIGPDGAIYIASDDGYLYCVD